MPKSGKSGRKSKRRGGGNQPIQPKNGNGAGLRPKRHFAQYTNRLKLARTRRQMHQKIRDQLTRRIPNNKAVVDLKTAKHIWTRHGCYQNATREATKPKNKGKMPSFFRNHRTLINSIVSTVISPNWTRTARMIGGGGRRGKGNWRFQKPRLGVKIRSGQGVRARPIRRFYFKRFKNHIGYSGRGYGRQGTDANAVDDEECYCCAVLLEGHRLITAFPMLTVAAERQGTGAKSVESEVVDDSNFDSGSDVSSSESIESDEGPDQSPVLMTAVSPSTQSISINDSGTEKPSDDKAPDGNKKDDTEPKSDGGPAANGTAGGGSPATDKVS